MEQIITVEAQQKAEETTALAQKYDDYCITTTEAYSGSAEDLKAIKLKAKELDSMRKSLTNPLDESKKRIMAFFKTPLTLLGSAEATIKSAMLGWQREQERIRKAEEQRLAEEQRKEAERLARLAAAAETRGDEKKAKEFKGRGAIVQSTKPAVASTVEPISGITKTEQWKFRIVDITKIPREYMMPNEVAIGQIARSTKGAIAIEGIEFYSEEIIRAGR